MSLKKGSLKKPEWLPDWKDVTKYPDPKNKKVSGRVWAWELLRRNPHYQQLWEKYEALPPGPIYEGHSAGARMDIRERFATEFGISHPAPPSMPFAHPDFKWRPKFITANPRYWILPVDWSEDDRFEMPNIDLEHPAEVLVKLDLRAQRKSQLIGVDRILRTEAKRLKGAGVLTGEPRAWFGKYQKYLRVLDAKLSSATTAAIAIEILGIKNDDPEYQKEKVRDAFKSAKRLRDRDYRFLTALGGGNKHRLLFPPPAHVWMMLKRPHDLMVRTENDRAASIEPTLAACSSRRVRDRQVQHPVQPKDPR
jgi:hypothetical protein